MSSMEARNSADRSNTRNLIIRVGMIALILLPATGILTFAYFAQEAGPAARLSPFWLKLCAVVVLSLFLPLLAYSYFFFRRERRAAEISRILTLLDLPETKYVKAFRSIHSGPYFVISVGMVWLISLAGLTILFFGGALGLDGTSGSQQFPKEGSQIVFGMAFLGAYVWGLKYVFRRYALNDLIPGVFFRLSIRMLMASTLALIVFNAYEALAGTGGSDIQKGAWPAVAFLLGTVPQRGLNWLADRIPFLADKPDPTVRSLPLEMIEGLGSYDRLRLEELGIDDCYGLANYDFIPLMLKSSYDARKIADWILQAKLCVRCGEAVGPLRQHGIRGIHDLAEPLSETEIEELAAETSATRSSLQRAHNAAVGDPEIKRLLKVAGRLSIFTNPDLPDTSGTLAAAG